MSISEQDKEIQELFNGFLIDTQELLESISNDLIVLENNCEDIEILNKLFRSFHSIKGTTSFMGIESMSYITHLAEDILNKLRRSELEVDLNIIDILLEVHDWLKLLLDRVKADNFEPVDYSRTIETLKQLNNSSGLNSKEWAEKNISLRNFDSSPDEENKTSSENNSNLDDILSKRNLINESSDFLNLNLSIDESAFNKEFENKYDIDSTQKNNSEPSNLNDDNKIYLLLNNYSEVKSSTDFGIGSETIRIDVNRVEALMNLSGELVLGRNRLSQIADSIELENCNKNFIRELFDATAQLDLVTSEIQAVVMKMRMVPIAKLYQKAPRIVRELSKEFGKKINLIVKGEDTEIDIGIIEKLNNPLLHLLRNSCDHGIETPDERIENGKSAEGNITLDAEQEGNAIVLTITDDGKGLDIKKIIDKAVQKEIITLEQANQISKREIYQLIFQPGFSTASLVTNFSGRGVGMDVVMTNIQKLKGIIDIESEERKYTKFIIKLPLTLAIIQGLLVKVGNETFAIPLSSVIEVLALNKDSIYSINHKDVIRLREDILPLVKTANTLNLKDTTNLNKSQYVVVVGIGLLRIGLIVDELLGQQEIVIKALGEYLGNIKGLAGSTILGDGKVIMIIDVQELVELSFSKTELIRFSA